jgi:hypothetical protein
MQASVFHPQQSGRIGCIVRDMSEDGAHLDFPHSKNLPTSFWLRLEGEPTLRLCNTVWRSDCQIGVEFSEQIVERRRAERWNDSHALRPKLAATTEPRRQPLNSTGLDRVPV